MGRFFKIFPNLSQNWLKFKKIFEKSGDFAQNLGKFGPKLCRLVYKWVTFSWKIGICMGLLSNFAAAHPYQNQSWVPPRAIIMSIIAQYFKNCFSCLLKRNIFSPNFIVMLIYLCSPTLGQISLKNSFGKVVFQILVTWPFSQNGN